MNQKKLTGRYLVTGGAGFLGSHLCEHLLNLGCEVICADNYITGKRANVEEFLANRNFDLMEVDIVESLKVDGQLAGIFHMASPASPIDYAELPIETLRVGSIGSENALKLAAEKKCPILMASTSEVYGDPQISPQPESYWGNVNPVGPRSCYDEAKRYMEALTMAYHRTKGVKTRIIRIFNTYGPKMRLNDGRVVPNFCAQALTGKNLSVFGDGSQTRSFCYVSDLIDGIGKRILYDDPAPLNLGNPVEMPILKFAEVILQLTKATSKIEFHLLPVDDPKQRRPDITKTRKALNWEPKVALEEGLKLTLDYFKNVSSKQKLTA